MAWLPIHKDDGIKTGLWGVLKSGILLLLIVAMTTGMTGSSTEGYSKYSGTAFNAGDAPTNSRIPTLPAAIAAAAAAPTPTPVPIDYSVPVRESAPVDETYFEDAVFIGDSRTQGFLMYSGISITQSLANVGLTVSSFFTDTFVSVNGQMLTACDALKTISFAKVYIMLGINELGWVDGDAFKDYYGQIIDTVREVNPDAIIYVQSILPVSKTKSEGSDVYTMANVDKFNGYVKETAEEKQAYYVNVSEAFIGEDGYLLFDASSDGVHLCPDFCGNWLTYLQCHTVHVK